MVLPDRNRVWAISGLRGKVGVPIDQVPSEVESRPDGFERHPYLVSLCDRTFERENSTVGIGTNGVGE